MIVLVGYFSPAFRFKSALVPRLQAFYCNQGYFSDTRGE